VDEEQGHEFITPNIERRQYRRVVVVTQVKCEALGREELLVTRDVSVGGLFINAKDPFPKESEVTLSFRLQGATQLVTCRGKIVSSMKGLGMGVQFFDLSEETRQLLQKFIDESN